MSPAVWITREALLVVLHVGLALAVGTALAAWVRVERQVLPDIVIAVAVLFAGSVLVFTTIGRDAIPLRWVTALHEGNQMVDLGQLWARSTHAGPNFRFLTEALASTPVPDIRDLVRMNLWLGAANLLLFLVMARQVVGGIVFPILLAMVYATNAAFIHGLVSELPAQAITAYTLLAIAASAPLIDERCPRWGRTAALLALALATTLVALTRVEVAGIGLCVLGVALLGRARSDRLFDELIAALRSCARWPLWAQVVLFVALAAVWQWAGWLDRGAWLIHGLHPLNPAWLTFPVVLWFFTSMPAVILTSLGIWWSARRRYLFLAYTIGVLVIFSIYFDASRGVFYNLFRLGITVTPVALLLIPLGWRRLQEIAAARAWRPRWQAWAVAYLFFLQPLLVAPAVPEFFRNGDDSEIWPMRELPLARNNQREVRYLLDLKNRFPRCTFITRVVHGQRPSHEPTYDLIVFRGSGDDPPIRDPGGPLRDHAAALLGNAPCAYFYRGLDCNLVHSDQCVDTVRGLVPSDRQSFANLPYNDAAHYGSLTATIELAVYPLLDTAAVSPAPADAEPSQAER